MKFLHFWVSLWLATTALATRMIKTSALLPCQASTEFSASKFDITFFPENRTADIDVQITSAIDGNFTVDLSVYAFGIKILTKTISGCEIAKTICPIYPGHFDVQTNIEISEDYVKDIPGIAYTFPDIDAVVIAKVYYADTSNQKVGSSVACIEAQLSNGKTVSHSYVSWITFGIIIFGVASAGLVTLWGHFNVASQIISNTISLFAYFQATATISMMAVQRMPPIAASWAENFMWTMGIISVKFMQNILSWYIRATGGKDSTVLENKQLSVAVYKRAVKESLDLAVGISKRMDLDYDNLYDNNPYSAAQLASSLTKRLDLNSNTTTTNEFDSDILGKTLVVQGIKRVAYLTNIEITNFFLTGATFFLFIGIFIVVGLVLLKLFLELFIRMKMIDSERFADFRVQYLSNTKGVIYRYFLVGFTQLSLLCLWEFIARDSPAAVVDACIMFAVLLFCLMLAVFKIVSLARQSNKLFSNPASILFGNPDVLSKWGFLYVQFNASSYYFLLPYLLYNFSKAATIALGQSNGKAQSIVYLVIEVIYFIVLCVVRPYMNKKTNGLNIAISVFSVVNAIFFLFFSQIFGEKLNVAASIMGLVYFVINAIFSLIFLILIIFACVWAIMHPGADNRYQPVTDDRNLFMPDYSTKNMVELDDLGVTARDGYRESYMHDDTQKYPFSDPEGSQSEEYVRGTTMNNFEGYRDSQSRDLMDKDSHKA